ncbi:MAG: SAM-dependent chlorinase/fluorinase [Chloroflexota bacterium]
MRRLTRVVTTPAAARLPHEGSHPFVSLLSDWGARDPSAAICRSVVIGIAPEALIVDITHEVEKFNIRHGALMLWCALPFMPIGAHMAVIDPGVGTARRPIAIETARGDYLVGPDNGLLLPAAQRLGGAVRVHSIENAQYRLPVVSSTFHGRDIFAPAAAHLALGLPLESIGPAIAPNALAGIDWPPVIVRTAELESTIIYRDTFGNVKLAGLRADLLAALEGIEHGKQVAVTFERGGRRKQTLQMTWAPTFGEVAVGDYLLYEDSYGRLCIAQNQGNAAESLQLNELDTVRVRRADATAKARRRAPSPREGAPLRDPGEKPEKNGQAG